MAKQLFFLATWIFTVSLTGIASAETIRVPRDAATIQAAIDQSEKGDTIEVAAGIYHETIKLKPNRTVRSAGSNETGKRGLLRAERTIIDGKKNDQQSGVAMAEGATLDGFTIRNVGTYDNKKWEEHHQTNGNDQDHEHIGRPSISGIRINNVQCKVINNIVHQNGYSGIVVMGHESNSQTPKVSKNICFRNMGAGISLMNHSTAVVSENKCFQNFYAGIGQNNASPHIINNECHGNIRAGIGISNGSCPVVERNRCYHNRRAGIGIRTATSTKPFISSNECFQNEMAGIGSEEFAAPVIIDNKCYENKLAGIGCRHHSSPTLIGNECFKNEKAGIGNDGDCNPLIISNRCFANKTAGIGFAKCKNGKALVLNNRFVGNSLVAMGVHPGWKVRAIGNHFERERGMPPLVMVFKGSFVEFVDNEFVGGGVAGIRCAGRIRVELCEFKGNQFRKSGPPNFGIWGLPDAEIDVVESRFSNWRHALASSQSKVIVTDSQITGIHQVAFSISRPVQGSALKRNILKAGVADQVILKSNDPKSISMAENGITLVK